MRQHTKYTLQQIGVVAFIILVVYAVFRHGDIGYDFHWAVLWEVNPTYKEIFGVWLLKGLYLTIKISLISTGIALLLGTIFGIARPALQAHLCPGDGLCGVLQEHPLLVQLFFWYFAFPMGLPETVRVFLNEHNYEFWAATCGLGVYTGAFVAEVVRAGIQAIPHGHIEAALSSGLTASQMLRKVVLPRPSASSSRRWAASSSTT